MLKRCVNGARLLGCYVFVTLCLVSFTACQPVFSIWVIPDSTASSLSFGLSNVRGGEASLRVDTISVFSCDIVRKGPSGTYYPNPENAVWVAESTNSPQTVTDRIYYGKEGVGLKTLRGPAPLEVPGCYVVLAYATDKNGRTESATLGFNIQSDGKVVEMSRAEYKSLFNK